MSRTLFKYTKAEYIDSILKDGGRLKLSRHEELNDPCDLNFIISEDNMARSYRMLLNVAFLCEFGTDPNLIKNKSFQTAYKLTMKSVKLDHKYKENPGINMMMTHYLKTRSGLKNYFNKYKDNFNSTYTNIIETLKERTLLGCLTSDCLNKLMWAHYAEKNTGICVEYEFENDEMIMDAIYTDKPNNFDLYTVLQYILPSQYFHIKETNENNKECKEACYTPFLRKTSEWEYEKESRLIFNMNNDSNIIKEDGCWFLPNIRVKSVILGCKMSKNDIEKIKSKFSNSNIKIFECKLNNETNKLELYE